MKILTVTPNASWIGIAPLPSALTRAGFTVGFAGARDSPLAHTRHVSQHWLATEPMDTANKLISLIQTACESFVPDLIVPLDDQTVRILHRIVLGNSRVVASDAFKNLLRHSLGDPNAYLTMQAKSRLDIAARASDIDMPPQVVCPDKKIAMEFARTHGYPVLLKPDMEWAGQGIHICHDSDTLAAALDAENARRTPGRPARAFSVQKFITGETAAVGLVARDGKLLGAIAYAKHRTTVANGPTSVARRLQRNDMIEAAARIVRHFGYCGFAGIDFVIEKDTQRAWMIEFNPRPTPICGRAHWMGADLAAALMADLRSTTAPVPMSGSEFLAFFPLEWYRNPRSPYLMSAHHDVPWDDPALLRYFAAKYPARTTRRSHS